MHAQCGSCFLSSAAPYEIKSSAWPLNRTLDHLVADYVGDATPFRSLEFSCNSHKDNVESIYFDNISWYGTGHLAPSVRDPRKMYRRLFSTKEIDTLMKAENEITNQLFALSEKYPEIKISLRDLKAYIFPTQRELNKNKIKNAFTKTYDG